MITKFLNGNAVYNKNLNEIKKKNEKNYNIYKDFPSVSFIIINEEFSSNLYIKNKITSCKKSLFIFFLFKCSKTIKKNLIKILIKILNNDFKINAIMIQKPIPKKFNKKTLFKLIKIQKDVDLMNPNTIIAKFDKQINIKSCISQAILCLLKKININKNTLNCSIFGFSETVGKPIFNELTKNGLNTKIIKENKKNFHKISKTSDVIIIGIGKPLFLKKTMLSYGSIVFDIGINLLDKKIVGDANIKNLIGKTSWITPVPGGVGALTIFYLLKNVLNIYINQKK